MKFNQFSRCQTTITTQVSELESLGLTCLTDYPTKDTTALWLELLTEIIPTKTTIAAKHAALQNLLATSKNDVLSFCQSETVDACAFYNVALQLLHFEVDDDFSLEQPLAFMQKTNLPYHEKINTQTELISAFYDLLNTPTKTGQVFLDYLATQGFFNKFYGQITQPLIFNGKTQPVFDTSQLIYEVVYIQSDLDSDLDGKCDLLKAEIIRPKETESNLKVPVLYTASPYNQGTNDKLGEKLTHDVNVPLTPKKPTKKSYEDICAPTFNLPNAQKYSANKITTQASETFARELSYTLNDYFLARGFAVVYAAGIGTRGSDGLRTCGSKEETLSTIAIIEWLTGKRQAFTTKEATTEIKAWWCNGNVAMTGKSYLGTLATAAATTGVSGLKTIISEAAISNWYDYYRDGGLVIAPGGFPGEDADVLCGECFSRKKDAADFYKIKETYKKQLAQITIQQDRASGNYNAFWDARNYLKDIANIKCDVVMVHGLNDWNVKVRNVYNLYQALQDLSVKSKLILHQGQHIYINNMRSIDFSSMMNLWLTNKLYEVANDADKILPDVLVQDNAVAETWHQFESWQTPDAKLQTLHLGLDELTTTKVVGQVSFNDQLPQETFAKYSKDYHTWQNELLTAPELNTSRLVFSSQPLTNDQYLTGTPKLKLKVASSKNYGMLSFMLVDLGTAKRLGAVPKLLGRKTLGLGYRWREDDLVEFALDKPSDFKLISKGHINLQNRTNLWQNDELKANEFYDLNVTLQPIFYHLPKGRRLALIVYSTDMEMTVRGNQDISYALDLEACELSFFSSKLS